MDQFTDLKIVEANRLHSEEAKAGNNENYSLWTNNLQDVLILNPKDQVSVFGAFISERGVGQSTSIEIKGVELGQKHKFSYTNISSSILSGDRIDNNLPSRASIIEATEKEDYIQIKDNELNFVINYFIPANAHNSVHLPRRYMWNYGDPRDNLINVDDRTNQGATRTYYNNHNGSKALYQAPAFYKARTSSAENNLFKPNNDNARYTLMIRDKTFYTENSLDGTLPDNDMRDPENAIYRTYRELKKIEIPAGFNSPDFIATEITRQLQNIINDETLIQDNTGTDEYPQPVSKILESETYKAFYSGNIGDNTLNNFLNYFNIIGAGNDLIHKAYRTGHQNGSGFEWLRQYGVIACKYPELYETGRLINMNASGTYAGIRGSELFFGYDFDSDKNEPFKLALEYTKENLDKFKNFFDAQLIYPEIIDNLNASASGYNDGCSTDNTRWIHINRFGFEKQSLANPPTFLTTQLGWGGYYNPRSYVPGASVQLQSLLLPLYFDKSQKDIYYDNPQFGLNQFTYGCLGRFYESATKKYYITIYPGLHETNGIGSPPFEELKATATSGGIPGGRRLGFDMHFNAPGMYYLLPLSGWTQFPNPTSTFAVDVSIWNVNSTATDRSATAPEYKMGNWKKLLYIGADNPQLNWDGTNFNFSSLHTPLQRGNKGNSGEKVFATPIATDDFASDEVYKLNEIELFNDWSPDRCPMTFQPSITPISTVGTAFTYQQPNTNIEPNTIMDQLCGIMVEDYGIPEDLWSNSLWGILGFSYKQFHGTNNRQVRIQRGNANDLTLLTTNAEVVEGDTKIYSVNWGNTPLYNNMITTPACLKGYNASGNGV